MPNISVFAEKRQSLHNYSSFTWFIPNNPQVAKNKSFIVNPVYLGGSKMVPTGGKILNFGLCEA